MQKPTVILILVAVLAIVAGAVFVPQLLAEPAAPVVQWGLDDEVDGADPQAEQAQEAQAEGSTFERTEAEPLAAAANFAEEGERVAAILRGRVIDKFQQPVANAKVWLEFGRGGNANRRGRAPNRRIPEPVETDAEGRFAFQGQAFRRLRVSLQVQHTGHAPGLFDKDLGEIAAATVVEGGLATEVELGDLVLKSGGQVRGRVTDLAGNGVPDATLTLEADFRNRLRWQRNRDQLIPEIRTDASGFYVWPNVAEGDYTIAALAKMHTPGRSDRFTAAEDKTIDVPDIQLGPGFELTGYVRDPQGQAIVGAAVTLRPSRNADSQQEGNAREGRDRGGRGARGGQPGARGRGQDVKTDEKGMFFAEHLPGMPLELRVDADGYLDHEEDGVDPRVTTVVNIAMNVGLSIKGVVQATDGSLVKSFAFRAVRLRGLPQPGQPDLTIEQIAARMMDSSLSDDDRRQLMEQMRGMRDQFGQRGGDRGGRGIGGGGGGGGGRDGLDKAEPHPDGTFVADGLQEGVYEVQVQSADHARFTSEEVTVRMHQPTPMLRVVVDAGLYCAGVVVDQFGDPIANADVELRTEQPASQPQSQPQPQPQAGNGRRNGGMDVARMAGEFMRRAQGRGLRLEAKTDKEGLFFIKHVVPGTYRLSASADGFADSRSEVFELAADRSNFQLRLESLGSIVGTVSGVTPAELGEARVGAVMLPEEGGMPNMFGRGGRGGGGPGGRGFRTVDINPDGSYRIDDLTPGQYVVRSWIGSPQQLMRELGPQFFDGSLMADAVVSAGVETRFDMQLTRPQVGSVVGSVMHNGVSANGFRVELRRVGDDATAQDEGPGGPGGGRDFMARMRNFGRTFSGTVAADGTYEVKDVAAGLYTLRVQSARRGGVLHEEQVQVIADAQVERSFVLTSASLEGTLLTDDGSDASALRGMAALLLNQTTVPEDLMSVMRDSGNSIARLRGGSFRFENVKPGSYLLVLRPQGREQTSQVVVVGGEEKIEVVAGAQQETADAGGNK